MCEHVWNKPSPERGSGTVMTVALILVALLATAGILALNRAHNAQMKAQMIADSAALAGGDISGVSPWEKVDQRACEEAESVARANGASAVECSVKGTDTYVRVTYPGLWGMPARAQARAGPDNSTGE